ncbi:MAG: HU family DNA-binding protein [Alphaproteobacteria bacterium]|nr:HU family DNA-binding protein [Alphaproteobacteria bacterium]
MNKNDLVNVVADKTELSKTKATEAVDAVFEAIEHALVKGDEVRLVGFGTFAVAKRKATEGRNPRTGETIKIPASKQPKFRAGKSLKEAVNKKR